jgi:hypothetical protein
MSLSGASGLSGLSGLVKQASSLTDPATISGIKAWWKASTIAQGDSTAVTTWTDTIQSIAPTQATAGNKPTYRTTLGPNSTPCVSFDGGDVLSVNVLGSNLWSTNAGHIFIVMKQTGSDAQNCPLCWFDGGSNTIEAFLSYDNVLYFDWATANAAGRASVAQPSGWDDSWRMVQLIREPPNTGAVRIRDQGSLLASNTSATSLITTGNTAPLNIGAQTAAAGIAFTGFITDILIYNTALSTTDRQTVEAYFNSLYGLF